MFNVKRNNSPWQRAYRPSAITQEKDFPVRLHCLRVLLACCCAGAMLFGIDAKADYAAKAEAGAGYMVTLTAEQATISDSPIRGTDGNNYYQVGNPISLGSNLAVPTGYAHCLGTDLGGEHNEIPTSNAQHMLKVYAPSAGFELNRRKAFRINRNTVMTIMANVGRIDEWQKSYADFCAMIRFNYNRREHIKGFSAHFPITITFYISELIVDGQLVFPAMDLAGYVRAYTQSGTAPGRIAFSINETTAPIRLAASQLDVSASCRTTSSTGGGRTVNLRHGQINSLNYDSLVTEKVNYTCRFAQSTGVRLRLDYTSDGDPQGRLPLLNSRDSSKKIYSDLKITDEATGQSGRNIKVDIRELKTIAISSHLQGSNATAGDYLGSAWLIATYD